MELTFRHERSRWTRLFVRFGLSFALLLVVSSAFGQAPTCTVNTTTPVVHAEGLAERVGDVTFVCTGGVAGNNASLYLYVTLPVNVTNRLDAGGNPTGISVTVMGGGAGPSSTGTPQLAGMTFSVAALSYVVPAAPASPVTIIISGIRAAVAMLGSSGPLVNAAVVIVGANAAPPPTLPIAITNPTLQASSINNGVPCVGSPLPTTLDFSTFTTTSLSSVIRVSEAGPNSFLPKDPTSDSGFRVLVNLAGYPAGSRVFVPDLIAGNDAGIPTSAGQFNSTTNGGNYSGLGQLILVRVTGADAAGAGGSAVAAPPVGSSFTSVSEVSLTGGKGYVVYEVADSNPGQIESAQIPLFLVAPSSVCTGVTPLPTISPVAAPVSTVMVGTASDPIPRYLSTPPPSDCGRFNDCSGSYFPGLLVDTTPIMYSAPSLGSRVGSVLAVLNSGGGILGFTSSVTFDPGASGWLTVTPATGQSTSANNANLQLVADPSALAPGTYTATVTVDAGNLGKASIPVTFTIGPVGVTIQSVGNAASFQFGSVAPGSYAVLFGRNLGGTNVGVTFNGFPANVVYASATQINLIVPTGVASRAAADVVVTADGKPSNTFKVGIVPNAPGIFGNGIVNFVGGAGNAAATPVTRGDFVVVYLTGLATPVVGLTVNIGNLTNLVPSFAGPQGTFPALDQVNIAVPASLPATPSPVPFTVCVPDPLGTPVCSPAVNLYVK